MSLDDMDDLFDGLFGDVVKSKRRKKKRRRKTHNSNMIVGKPYYEQRIGKCQICHDNTKLLRYNSKTKGIQHDICRICFTEYRSEVEIIRNILKNEYMKILEFAVNNISVTDSTNTSIKKFRMNKILNEDINLRISNRWIVFSRSGVHKVFRNTKTGEIHHNITIFLNHRDSLYNRSNHIWNTFCHEMAHIFEYLHHKHEGISQSDNCHCYIFKYFNTKMAFAIKLYMKTRYNREVEPIYSRQFNWHDLSVTKL